LRKCSCSEKQNHKKVIVATDLKKLKNKKQKEKEKVEVVLKGLKKHVPLKNKHGWLLLEL
jgi:mRNA-degrading endonuclease YafQ of YafQ-DinJ toxin-antitoxin module